MAGTQVWLANPETSIDNVIEGTANTVIESSYIVEVKLNLGSTGVNDNGTTRQMKKQEAIQSLQNIVARLLKDDQSYWG